MKLAIFRDGLVRLLVGGSIAMVLSGTLVACGGGSAYGGGGSSPPPPAPPSGSPSISASSSVAPAASANRSVSLMAAPTVASGVTVTNVDFLVDGASIGTVTTSPYTKTWDTTTVADGAHMYTARVTDSQGQTATSTAVSINVLNKPTFSPALSPGQVVPSSTSSATGTSSITVNLATGAVSGKITVADVTATGATINSAFAGTNGTSIVTLSQNATTSAEWDVPTSAILAADQITALLEGKLYLTVASAANPGGDVRGQILPANVSLLFNAIEGRQEVPAVTITALGVVVTTVDSIANVATVEVNSTGVDDATAAEVDTAAQGAIGARVFSLTKDPVDLGHWSHELAQVTAAEVASFTAGKWYVNIITPAHANGAIRGQITSGTGTTPLPAAPTLTQMQALIFSHCGSCHTGVGTALPGVQNLTTAANTFANLVGVDSVEQPGLKRVAPGDAENSYVVRKLEGSPSITGARMPFGGPFFDQATIDQLKAWINAGAQNN